MRFWNKLEKSFLRSRSGKQHAKTDIRERFDAVDEEKLSRTVPAHFPQLYLAAIHENQTVFFDLQLLYDARIAVFPV